MHLDYYNNLEIPKKQGEGEDGDAGGSMAYEYQIAPAGLRRHTRQSHMTARTLYSPHPLKYSRMAPKLGKVMGCYLKSVLPF
jgi:hypothetical protein